MKLISILLCASLPQFNGAYSFSFMKKASPQKTVFSSSPSDDKKDSRRAFFYEAAKIASVSTIGTTSILTSKPTEANAIGPVKIDILNPVYSAAPCPPERPIPGMKAMKGMRGLCVTVSADLKETSPKDLVDVGVYGFVKDAVSGDSVLANNPDLSTDAGQFTMVKAVTTTDKKIEFDFVAAVPMEKTVEKYENGIGPLSFESLRIISFPGGQQYGAINPCEMNEFSSECEVWEEENGPYEKKEFMVKSNPRTKGR